jgi:hypothetical protein
MKNLFKVFGIIALVAVIGFSFVACGGDDGGGGGGGGGGRSALIGKWYAHQREEDHLPQYYMYWFQSNGKLNVGTYYEFNYTATATQVKTTGDWANYTISGNVLTITDLPGKSSALAGTFYKHFQH